MGRFVFVPVIAYKDFKADNDEIYRSTDQDEYLFSEVFHALKIIEIMGFYNLYLLIGY